VPDQTGASGVNEPVTKQVLDPSVATTAKGVLSTVITSGTGKRAQTGHTLWGKTGTTDNNGDAWFCGATKEITACVWVGHADSVTPMETEFGGLPVDGGTFPAEIFAQVVNAYDELEAARKAGEDTDTSSTTDSSGVPGTESVAPSTDTAPAAPTDSAPAPTDTAPAGGGGGSTGGGTAPSTGSAGGVSPG
jgi:penicillin-binding protein 1A